MLCEMHWVSETPIKKYSSQKTTTIRSATQQVAGLYLTQKMKVARILITNTIIICFYFSDLSAEDIPTQQEELVNNNEVIEILNSIYENSTREIAAPEDRNRKQLSHFNLQEPPERIDTIVPLSAEVVITHRHNDEANSFSRTVSRHRGAVYVNYLQQGQEWKFIQNKEDRRRTTGILVDHHKKMLLEYQESDLRIGNIVQGWAEVFSLGFPSEKLDSLKPTGESVSESGILFKHLVDNPDKPTLEVWWSDQYYLPLRFIARNGEDQWEQKLTNIDFISADVEEESLQSRFPTYSMMDVVDWREEFHDH